MKDSFIIFTESRELINECLDETQKAMLLDALFAYACGEPVNLDSTTKAVFISMRQKIDAANQKYEDKCQTNRENGMKGGRPKKTERIHEETEKTERLFSETEKTLPDHDNDPDIKERSLTRSKEKFSAAWDAYPKKQGKKEAEAAYKRAIRDGTTHEQIMAGIDAYKAYLARCHIEDQYVKQGSTFFRQQAWNDDWTGTRKTQTFNFTPRGTDYDALLAEVGV